jgi:hypothetical protein
MAYFKLIAVIAGVAAFCYYKRYGFRQAWYILRTGDKDPDFEKLDAEYFLGRKGKE